MEGITLEWFLIFIYFIFYLTALGLSGSLWDPSLQHTDSLAVVRRLRS